MFEIIGIIATIYLVIGVVVMGWFVCFDEGVASDVKDMLTHQRGVVLIALITGVITWPGFFLYGRGD